MKLLLVVSNYPYEGHPYSGAFNERSALALRRLGHEVEVLAPRPYVPRGLSRLASRWSSYASIPEHETRAEIAVYRPAYAQLPLLGGALWSESCAYAVSAGEIARRHRRAPYDAILSFGLIGAGGIGWRLGRRLAVPAAGWATGNDVRVAPRSSFGKAVRRSLEKIDLVFYQSAELRACGAALLNVAPDEMDARRHAVLPRGVEEPPVLSSERRHELRRAVGLGEEQVVVLYLGRIAAPKGVFELAQAMARARERCPELICWMVGAKRGFDDSAKLARCGSVRLIDACAHEQIWDYFAAADIFAFPSHGEGMPNSLLEAMSTGLPAVAYAIPPIEEIDQGSGALLRVAPGDVHGLADALVSLARTPERRAALGRNGRARVYAAFLSADRMASAARRVAQLIETRGVSFSQFADRSAAAVRR